MDTVFSVGTKSKFAAAQYLGAVLHILHFFYQTERRLWYH